MSTPTFEERYTAWIDGLLAGEELAQFERELETQGRAEAESDRADAHRLGQLLRSQAAPLMPRADLFNEQLLQRIAVDKIQDSAPVLAHETPARETTFWTLPNLAWAATVCLLATFAIYQGTRTSPERDYQANLAQPSPAMLEVRGAGEIIKSETKDPNIYATALRSDGDDLTVLWLDGLDYLPASYQLQ